MNRFRNFLPLVAILATTVILAAPTQAQAAFKMTLSDSDGNSFTVNDNNVPPGTALDLDPATGQIIFSGVLGAFNIQISVGTSNAPGTANLAELTINNTSISSAGFTGDKTVTITLEDTGFTSPTGKTLMESQLSTTQLPANSNVTFRSFLNGVGGTLLTLNTVGGTRIADSVNISSTPYTLANTTTYTVHGQGIGNSLTVQTTGLTAVAVPAPPAVILALTGLPFAGVGCWLRRRRKA